MKNTELIGKMAPSKCNKEGLLNKFLSKTYHMIERCDKSIADWAPTGDSFVIKDIDSFTKNVLPLYFKHSKFASFVRQLNFYSFRKIRLDPDLNVSTKSVRFAHDYFRSGHPGLLHRIQRSTRANDGSSTEIRTLKDELSEMSHQLDQLSSRFDNKLEHMTNAIEVDYEQRMAKISFYHQRLSKISSSLGNHPVSRPSSPPKMHPFSLPHSPRSTMCPLMTLSGVAAMIEVSEKADS